MSRLLLAIAALSAYATAQTFTSCNPLNSSCPSDPALGTTWKTDFTKSMSAFDPSMWNVTSGASLISFGSGGASLALTKSKDSVTVQSNFYIMFGQMEIIFKAAEGQGIISTAILISDDLDEIDWEIKGSNYTTVSNNWYGHGNLDQYNSQYPLLANAPKDYHNYTVDWTKDYINYILDGQIVRTVPANVSGEYPQTPCMIRFGIWAAGDASQPEGTVAWAGGPTDWSKAPFSMLVKSLRVTDGQTNVTSYSYGDNSGSWQSIKSTVGVSQAYKNINKMSTSQQAINNWNGLSTGAKIGIAAGVAGFVVIATLAFCIWCCMQRKRGREEKRLADKEWDDHQSELLAYRRMQQKGGFAVSHMDYRESNRF